MKDENILIIGTDCRLEYTSEFLEIKGFSVKKARTESETEKYFCGADVIILPLPVSRDGVTLNCYGEKIELKNISEKLTDKQIVTGGMFNGETEKLFTVNNRKPFDYFAEKNVAIKNAVLTAEGVLGIVIDRLPFCIHNTEFAVTGYGKCGREIARKLNVLGGKVTVVVRSKTDRAFAFADGNNAVDFSEFENIGGKFRVIINTVPVKVIDENIIKKLDRECTLIEVASAPFGVDFGIADKYGINVIKASSLPGKTSPETAGYIIGESVYDYLKGE